MWIVGLCLIGKNIYGASDSGVCSPKKQDYAFLKNFQDIFWKKKIIFLYLLYNVIKPLTRQDIYVCMTIVSSTKIWNTVVKIIYSVCAVKQHLWIKKGILILLQSQIFSSRKLNLNFKNTVLYNWEKIQRRSVTMEDET